MTFAIRRGLTLAAATALAIGAAACGSSSDSGGNSTASSTEAAAKQHDPALTRLITAAEEEGALNLNWGLHTRDNDYLIDAFKEAYDLDLAITLTPSQNQPGNLARLTQEYQARRPSSTDAFLGVPELIYAAGPEGADVLERVDWPQLAPWTRGLENSDSTALTMLDQISGFAYNTTQFDEDDLPQQAADVLSLEQPIASTPYAAMFNTLGSDEAMGREGVLDYLTAFEPAGLFGCGEMSRISSGEFAALWITCGKNIVDIYASQGAPLATHMIRDAAITYPWYMAVPKHAQNPSAAKLWVTWLTTPEAQKLLFEHEMADNRRIAGSQTARQIEEYEADGVRFLEPDYEFAIANPELFSPQFKGELIKRLTSK